jgi:TRAP-type mannitol/chloroaromatic compound transport system substrate-binding protein
MTLEIVFILLLIVTNAVLAMSETAVVSSRKTRLEQWASEGNHGAAIALELASDPTRFLSTVQFGITLIGIFAGAFGGATIAKQLAEALKAMPWLAAHSEAIAFGLVVFVITMLSLILGELVPAFEVLDAVGSGVAEMGHTAAFYWQGKQPAAAFYTTVPFGLTPVEHVAWIDVGGRQALWDELYAPFGAKPFMAGNTGVCMGGWFRRELNSGDDLKGLKIRSLGLGGEIYRRLGATPQTTSPGEILTSMQSGLIDGAEFVGPGSDIALGLYRVASFYYAPGFNKPNGTGECIIFLKAWEGLDSEMKAIVQHACAAEAAFALGEMERLNAEALAALIGRHGVKLRIFPQSLISAARRQASDVVGDLAGKSTIARRIFESYSSFRDRTAAWSRISIKAVLQARESAYLGLSSRCIKPALDMRQAGQVRNV